MLNKNNKNIFLFRSRFLKQKEYWIKKLSGDLTSTGILFDFDNGQPLETDDGKIEIPIPADLGARVVKLSKGSDLSIYILLLAALKILIFRYTANEDINIISPLDRWKVTEETINSLLFIRDQIEMGQTFKEVVLNIRQSVLDAYENQDYPYEMLLEYLYASAEQQNPRTISDTQCSLAGLHDDRNIEIIKSSLAIHFVRDEDRLRGYISYEIPTYKKSEVSRFAGHFLCLLASALENPGTRVADISILTEQEQEQLLVSFNDNKTGSAGDKTIVQFLQEQGEKIPDRVNLCCQAEHITYRELNRRVEVLAKVLRDSGVREERTVGILQARSPRLVESILAVWQAGGAYIPIDPDYPLERIEYMLKDSGAKLLVTTSSKEIEKVRRWEGEIILLDEINEFLKSNVTPLTHLPAHLQSPSNPDVVLSISTYQVRSAKLAYIIYTSGSTGRPKGAMIEHLGMMNHINAKITGLRLSDRSIVGQNASHTFDISVWQFFAVVVVGGKTVIYSNELILESGKFLKQLIKDQITVLEVVPSYLSLLLNPVRDEVFLPLEYLLVTGEEVKPSLVKQWFNRYPQIRMVNAYGPTEASDDITHYFMDKVPETARIPIGKPLQNFTIYIVDKNMNLCPIGVKGEIWVGGVGVGRGYLNNPEVTKDKFKTKKSKNKSYFGGSRGAVYRKSTRQKSRNN
ncbi:MAG: hypothetical protein QG657_1832, partial [Acidobacteriota bacterium]|nr:hypothetical protein [Acidobacteriota bacterium]